MASERADRPFSLITKLKVPCYDFANLASCRVACSNISRCLVGVGPSGKRMKIEPLDQKRFDALVNQSRSPGAAFVSEELSWWASPDESVIGVVLRDTVDDDYLAIALGRDETGQYRAFDIGPPSENVEEAKEWLQRAIRWHARDGQQVFPQGDTGKAIDFFTAIAPEEKLHPHFVILRDNDAYLPARKIINLMAPHFKDIDGNFVQQFQTTGFDARLWELYIHAYLVEEELFFERDYNAPDFVVAKFGERVGIEAVIVGRKEGNPARYFKPEGSLPPRVDVRSEHENAMPIRFGSPLFSKLKKKYWQLPHMQDTPIIIAVADFHDDASMTWSGTALINYLYGVRHDHHYDDHGKLVISTIQIETHRVGEKEIPSGFFSQPDAENISAILFSASGTISKFNRMGRQAGFKHPNVRMIRFGTCHDHDENASLPRMYQYEVDETSSETWAEGVSIFHNPNAKHPVREILFPRAAHHRLIDGQIVSMLPEFYPYASITWNLQARRERG